MLPSYPSNCFRGFSEKGTHMHIWWTCYVVFVLDWSISYAICIARYCNSTWPDHSVTKTDVHKRVNVCSSLKRKIGLLNSWCIAKLRLLCWTVSKHLTIWLSWVNNYLPFNISVVATTLIVFVELVYLHQLLKHQALLNLWVTPDIPSLLFSTLLPSISSLNISMIIHLLPKPLSPTPSKVFRSPLCILPSWYNGETVCFSSYLML